MDEFEQAVVCSLNPTGDPTVKAQATAYCDSFKISPNGWSVALARFVQEPAASTGANADLVRFFCLHVLEDTVTKRYDSLGPADRARLKEGLMQWLRQAGTSNTVPGYIWNKFAQVLTLIFRREYIDEWRGFFTELVGMLGQGPVLVHTFLRVCTAIHDEVVSRTLNRTQDELRQNSAIKDTMRQQCVHVLAQAWGQILQAYGSNGEIISTCLTVIGQYVSWIDIGLVVNDQILPLIFGYLKVPSTRQAACQCVSDIVNKGMPGAEKVRLLQTLGLLPAIQALATGQEDDEDFLDGLAKLLDTAGTTTITALQEAESATPPQPPPPGCNELLDQAVGLMFGFLNHDIDDVSAAVAPFAQAYIGLVKFYALKRNAGLTATQQSHMQSLVQVITRKLKYDDEYNFERQGEDEAFFDDYRKTLLTMLTNMAALDPQAIVAHTDALLQATVAALPHANFADVEVALLLLYQLGESIPAPELYQTTPAPSPLYGMLARVLASPIPGYPHRAVNLMFFECLARYWRCFTVQPEGIPSALDAFFSNVGLNHPASQVRSQACYVFSKFCRQLLKQMQSYLDEILRRIQPLLILRVGRNGARGPSGMNLTYEDQLYLFETASALMFAESVPAEQQQLLLEGCLGPLMTQCTDILNQQRYLSDTETMPTYTTFLVQAMGVVTRVAKCADKRCTEYFLQCFRVFVPSLSIPVNQANIRQAVITYCHRMVASGGQVVLPEMPPLLVLLLQTGDAQVVSDTVTLVTQLISKFKGAISVILCDMLLGIVKAIFDVLNAPFHPDDREQIRLLAALKQTYFKLLFTIATCELTDVFLTEQNMPHLPNILQTAVEGATDASDPSSQKSAFGVLRSLVQAWLGPEKFPGFTQYCYDSIVPACFVAVLKPDFDMADAQSGMHVMNEVAQLQKTLYTKLGAPYLEVLATAAFPALQIPQDMAMEYVQGLRDLPEAQFKKFFRQFIKKKRG